MTILATDNEAYATELWGDKKEWDDERKQFVPTGDDRETGQADEPAPVDEPVDKAAKPRKSTAARAATTE